MRLFSRIAAACFVVALPVFLITANVRFAAGDVRFYERGFRKYNASAATGVALPELDRAAREIIDYFENDATTLRIIVNENGQETSLFNAKETAHMKDVKKLMQAVYRANEVSLAVILVYVGAVVLWARERSPRGLAKLAWLGMGVGAVAVAVVGVFALTGFDAAWSKFHEIVFRNDLWKLNPDTDHLIQMFPERFWEEMTYFVGLMTVVEALLVVGTAGGYLLLTRKGRGRRTED